MLGELFDQLSSSLFSGAFEFCDGEKTNWYTGVIMLCRWTWIDSTMKTMIVGLMQDAMKSRVRNENIPKFLTMCTGEKTPC
jgi:hypothetical protein